MSIAAFGIMYALCAYIMGYYWNIIWLDTIALLPLVIAGALALLRDGKFKLYIAALALSILANYYIGLFTCAFVLLVSIGYTVVEYKGLKSALRNFFKMLGCSIIGVMMSAVLTLPAYFALGHTQSSDNTFPSSFAVNIGSTPDLGGVLEGIGKTIANSAAFLQPTAKEGLPNIYCGVFTVFLAMLFFFCSKIKKRERIFCGLLALFFMLSFIIRQLDFMWHGFHFPNMLPYRFSFLYSFLIIYMAFRVFMYIDDIKLVSVIAAILGFAVYLGIASVYFTDSGALISPLFQGSGAEGSDPDPVAISAFIGMVMAAWVLLYSLRDRLSNYATAMFSAFIGLGALIYIIISADVFSAPLRQQNSPGEYDSSGFIVAVVVVFALVIVAIFLALISKQLNADQKMLRTMLGVILLVLALFEGLISSATGVKTVSITDGSYYPLGTTDTLKLVETIDERESGNVDLPHAEVNKYYTLNDNALIGVNGISMFNSMVNSRITDFYEKFGLCGWVASNRYTYQESSPFTNLMLNMKYIIAPYGAYLDKTHNSLIDSSGSVKLMENNYYLPQGFVVNSDLLNYDNSSLSALEPIDNQNKFFRLATGLDGNIYDELEYTSLDCSESSTLTQTSAGKFSYNSSESSDSYRISYTAPTDGTAVAYYETYYTENVSLSVNGMEAISYYIKRPFIMMIGDVKAGDTITCTSTVSGSYSGNINCRVAIMNEDLFNQARSIFSRSVLAASEVTDDSISGNINVAEDGLFYTSISYVEGWHAYVDGQEVEITPVGDALLAFNISAGPHIIKLKYIPEGFTVGLTLSLIAVLLFAAMIIIAWRKPSLLRFMTDPKIPSAEE